MLPTPATSLAARVSVTVQCRSCRHARALNLAELVERGHGDTPLRKLPLRCECGAQAFDVIVSGKS